MAIEVGTITPAADARSAIVQIIGDSKSEVTGTQARTLALQQAQRHIGKNGFSSFGDWSMITPDGDVLTEEQCLKGAPVGSRHVQELNMKASI